MWTSVFLAIVFISAAKCELNAEPEEGISGDSFEIFDYGDYEVHGNVSNNDHTDVTVVENEQLNETGGDNVIISAITINLNINNTVGTTTTSTTTSKPSTTTTSKTTSKTTATTSKTTTTTSKSTTTTFKTTTTTSKTTTSTSTTSSDNNEDRSSIFKAFNLYYLFLLLLVVPVAIIIIGTYYYCKRKKKSQGYIEPIRTQGNRRNSTPSWVFSEPDFEDEEVTSVDVIKP